MSSEEVEILVIFSIYAAIFVGSIGYTLVTWGISYQVYPKNQIFMTKALNKLKPRWGVPIGVTAIMYGLGMAAYTIQMVFSFVVQFIMIIGIIVGAVVGVAIGMSEDIALVFTTIVVTVILTPISIALSIFTYGPTLVGFLNYFLHFSRNPDTTPMTDVFKYFNGWKNLKRSSFTFFLWYLYYCLWMMLFIVPGIIKYYSYSQTFFILDDHPELSPNQAITLSRKMMDGHKAELFWLQARFGGWGLVSLLSGGVGALWYLPYLCTTSVEFYEKVKAKYEANQI